MRCYQPSYETSQQKSNDSSLGHKVAELASWALQGKQQGHPSGYAMAGSQSQCYGQSHAFYPDQTASKTHTEYYSRTPTHYPEHTKAKTETHCYSQTDGYYSDHHEMTHGQAYGHTGHYASNGTAFPGKTEKKVKNKYEGKKKEKSLLRKKSNDRKRSCSDGDSSGSDSDWRLHQGKVL